LSVLGSVVGSCNSHLSITLASSTITVDWRHEPFEFGRWKPAVGGIA
jgi:hypothetical protein